MLLPVVNTISSHLKELVAFIKDNNVLTKRNTPQNHFTSDQCAEILAYHSRFDVFTQNGLRKWQHFVFEHVVGLVTGARNNNALPLGKNIQQKLDQIQMESESVLISLDVSSGLAFVLV